NDPIAIVGVAGRYPQARNLREFWDNLCQGRDCITEIPSNRWSLEGFFDPDRERPGYSYSKWGGFIDDVDKFDPLFFNISPADAEQMDPQERLFLETVWHTLEDAGYTRSALSGANVGVFVGAMWSQYQLYAVAAGAHEQAAMPSSIHGAIANRVSYFFDFKGPSVALDTMCSAALAAIHYACESIRRDECELAVAGGVNVTIHPHKYLFLSKERMVSSDGRCRSFASGGDGFVPGEGVGALLLKPLTKALADGDRIHGLIRGSALGHNGRTGGYMVPDPQAQARTLTGALRAAGVEPGSISYVEAQGIGSQLGDQIEIDGLCKALAGVDKQSCAIGSVKSNIGHLESAAGMASLSKVLLQMRHGQLVPSLHAETLNPDIDFAATPFYVQRRLTSWPRLSSANGGAAITRRAVISGLGAGGVSAQLIVEEFPQPNPTPTFDGEQLILLSARTGEALQALVRSLADTLENDSELHLSEIAWTLQYGREAMEERLAFIVSSVPELRARLIDLWHGTASQRDLYRSAAGAHAGADGEAMLGQALRSRNLRELAQLWVGGVEVDWRLLYSGTVPCRLSLPGYPFARERYAVNDSETVLQKDAAQRVMADIVCALSEILKVSSEKLSAERSFSDYGLGSVNGLALIRRLNARLGIALRTTALYDYASIDALTDHILQHHAPQLTTADQAAPVTEMPEAVVGYRALRLLKPGDTTDIAMVPLIPVEPGDDEVQVAVKAFSLNFGDLLCVKGLYPTMPAYPFTPGMEFSGVVLKTGRNVTRVSPGEQVVGLTGEEFGAHSQIVTTPQHLVVVKPDNVSPEEACAFPVVFLTVHQVFERARPQAGEKVLIQTAAGGVGLIAVQMALEAGAEVFATAGSSAKLDYLRKLGVHHVINYRQEDFAERIRELTNGEGVDVVVNTLAGDAIQKGLDILAPWGRYVEIAMTALKFSAKLDLSRLVRNQSFFSIDLRRFFLERPEPVMEALEMMAATLQAGNIKPTVGKVFAFEQVRDAYRWLEARENIGKVVVTTGVSVQIPSVTNRPLPCPPAIGADMQDAHKMEIAIVGVAGRFPGARNLEAFWRNLADGRDSVIEVPHERWSPKAWFDADAGRLDKTYCPWGGFLDEVDRFDPLFFNMSGKEARLTDPAQRLFLEQCWNALEVAGCDADKLSGAKCGVFVGTLSGDYRERMAAAAVAEEAQSFWGNSGSVLAARIAFFLNLKGPAVAIDTACSSSLVAVHMACQSLRAGECELAIAGGVHVSTTPHLHVVASNAEMLSRSGRCRTFDDAADGFVPGEGVGAIVLKPLASAHRDGDPIYGIIRGSGINQDGKTNGITAPSTLSQSALLTEVYRRHGIDPSDRHGFCPVGSVKTNIGHAIAAAGIAGVIKVLLALQHRQLPPSLHLERENEHIDFIDSPFYVLKTLQEWPAGSTPRRAAVSSFGFSGTNAHLVIEEGPAPASPPPQVGNPYYAVPLSAKTDEALGRRLDDLHEWLVRTGDQHRLADLAYTLSARRTHFAHRCVFVVRDLKALRDAIEDVRQG
ncbi:MAG: beta-ketoacyl synthase N-terminal-like domain-containing protein, partial [Candidatus Thiodiazotropha sp.]